MPIILNDFHRIVRRYPDRTAIVHCLSGGRTAKITFAELDRRSEELAACLTAQGIASGDLVGIYMRRSIDHVAAILGILKTGAAFYSLNPRTTLEQVTCTARLSRARTILVDNEALLHLRNIRNDGETAFTLALYTSEALTPLHQQFFDQIRETFPLSRVHATGSSAERYTGATKYRGPRCGACFVHFRVHWHAQGRFDLAPRPLQPGTY